ncbi:MAG: 2-succinyl-6-hydroxy-2,4-cyclohexadiene-1-carboxylate synthase [Chloroflexota bacterium]|nr:2-succinyl-6-hydroxy-2,4-cyclohexadiene-1-carboxylate synthase [Chloroflexota bacterium]
MDGAAAAPPLVLLHGFTGSAHSWEAHTAALAAHYRVLRPDLPGHGATPASTPADCAIETVARQLARLIETTLAPPVTLLGYSMGGRLALYTALEYPQLIHTLILESASPGIADDAERLARRAADDALAQRILDQGITRFVDAWERLPLFATYARLPDETRTALRQARLANDPTGLAHSLRGMGTGVQPSLWARLPALSCHVLLITGADDAKFTGIARQMMPTLPDGQHVIITASGHTPHLEQPDAFQSALQNFMRLQGR